MTGRSKEETADITLLGNQKTQYPSDYAPEMLETFENKHQGNDYFVNIFFHLKIARYSSKVHILVTSLNCSLTKLLLHYTIIQLYQHACQPPQNLS